MSDSLGNNGSEFFRQYNLVQSRTTSTKKEPAAHQQTALDKLGVWYSSKFAEPHGAILVLPTGGGKTFTAVHFTCRHPLSEGFKVLWLAHTHHLLEQALQSFDGLVKLIAEPKSHLAARVVSGATGHFPVHSIRATDDVVIASLPACAKAAFSNHQALDDFLQSAMGKLFVIFDEAHHSPAPTYRRLLQHLRARCPNMKLLGLTATPTYTDEKKRGWLAELFPQGIVHQETPQKLMAARILAKPVFEEARTKFEPDFTDREYAKWVGTNRDIPEETVSYLAENRSRNEYIAGYYLEHRERFGKTLIFADRWAQCETICTLLNSKKNGVRADAVYSHVVSTHGTPEDRNRRTASENAEILQKFRDGRLDVLVNVRMLTEGTDVPDVNTVFLTRQTTSQILLTQMVGRALRGPNFGGTEKAYIVSFIDDWKQRINWAAYEQLADGPIDDSTVVYGKRPPIQLISIDLIRRLAAQMDSGININPGPFRSFLPLGWFRVEFDAQVEGTDDIEPMRQLILVYEHDKPRFDKFVEALKGETLDDFEENSVQFENVRPRLEEWEARFFTEAQHRIGLALVNDMFSVVRHMAQNDKTEPTFFPFDTRELHDLDGVAERFIAEKLGFLAADESLRTEFVRQDRFWKVIYPRYEQFKSHFDACVNRILYDQRHGRMSSDHRPIFATPEAVPDREPSDELKEQVKSRDHYRCLCCGCRVKRLLQVDHIAPSYTGGRNHLDNLQTLCRTCNQAKATKRIVFRTNQNILTTAPSQVPGLSFPSGHFAKEAEQWETFLRRWVNFFYQCAAVDTVDAGEKGERLRVWAIRLFPGNDPTWLAPHLASLVRQIQEARQEAGYTPAPDRITVNEPVITKAISAPEEHGHKLTTLDEVLSKIEEVEGFQVWISYRDGRKVRGDWTKGIRPYPYENALNGEVTVETWKHSRCLKNLPVFDDPNFQVEVMDGARYFCAGQRKLRTVRDSYRG
jgi:ATP-dependent helicase IRC3